MTDELLDPSSISIIIVIVTIFTAPSSVCRPLSGRFGSAQRILCFWWLVSWCCQASSSASIFPSFTLLIRLSLLFFACRLS